MQLGSRWQTTAWLMVKRVEPLDFAGLVEDLEVMVWQVDASGQLYYGNQRWWSYSGAQPGQLALSDYLHPDERALVQKHWGQVKNGIPQTFELRLRSRSGEYRWFLCKAVPRQNNGNFAGWTASCMDISEHKQSEIEREKLLGALQASRARLETVLQELPIAAVIAEAPSGQIVTLNRRAEIILGRSLVEEKTEQQVFGLLSTQERPLEPEEYPIGQVLRSGQTLRNHELLIQKPDKATCWILLNAGPLYGEAGQIEAVLVTFADISDRKQAEEYLRRSEQRYRLLAESQKRFVADASHELRAPLTAIQGNLELLQRFKHMSKADHDEAIVEASREAARLGRLVADLLSLARGDTGDKLQMAPVALHQIALEAFNEARHLGPEHRLELGTLQEISLCGHRDRLKQLLVILLDNAIKYTPAGGRVSLELLRSQQACLRVIDSGIGIANDDLPHVFERFYRSDKSRSQESGGSGLGLSIAKWIVEQHGGSIELQSQVNQGTTAVVNLPLGEQGESC